MHILGLYLVLGLAVFIDGNCKTKLSLSFSEGEEGQGTTIYCDTESCGSEVLFKKKVSGRYEIALKFTSLSDYQGYELSNSVNYDDPRITGFSLLGEYSIDFEETIVQDTGTWRCSADEHDSNEEILIVNSKPSNVHITIETPPFILVGSQHEYTCSTRNVYPELDVLWNINSENVTGDNQNEQNGDVFDIVNIYRDTLQKRMEYDVICYMGKSTGNITWSIPKAAEPVEIFAPALIENFELSENHPISSDMLYMTCLVSGTNHMVTWLHNATHMDDTMFIRQDTTIYNDFRFGHTNATNSTIRWKVTNSEKSCEYLNSYNGDYTCRASAEKGPDKDSAGQTITVKYAPILVTPGDEEIAAMINETVTMTCIVKCASPSDVTYIWTSENDRDGIGENATIIEITVTEDDFQDTFTCTVENSIGAVSKRLSISKKETTIAMTTTTELLPTSSGPAESSANKSGLDFGARLGIGFTVGIVFCGIIVSSVIIYHRTKCYKKQKTSLHQNAYENEDITLDDHADVTPYEQVNDIDYEPDHPTNYVNVKPTSYVNVKSTSFANIDPTSYVNVNAMEPSKYEQLKQRNSGNIEISTYEDLNGKAK